MSIASLVQSLCFVYFFVPSAWLIINIQIFVEQLYDTCSYLLIPKILLHNDIKCYLQNGQILKVIEVFETLHCFI